MVMRQVVPRLTVGAVILPDRPPLPLADVRLRSPRCLGRSRCSAKQSPAMDECLGRVYLLRFNDVHNKLGIDRQLDSFPMQHAGISRRPFFRSPPPSTGGASPSGLPSRPAITGRRLCRAGGRRRSPPRPGPRYRARPAASRGTDAAAHRRGRPEARAEVHFRYARGEGVVVDGDLAPFHDALIRSPPRQRCRPGISATPSLTRCCRWATWPSPPGCPAWPTPRASPAHLPVRPVGFGEDLLARRHPGAAADRDGPADSGARSELRLRAPGPAAP